MSEPLRWIRPNETVDMLYIDDRPAYIQLAASVELEVTHTDPGARGDTASGGGTKPGDAGDRRERERPAVRQHRRPGEGGHALGRATCRARRHRARRPRARPSALIRSAQWNMSGRRRSPARTPRSARARGSASRAPVAPLPASACGPGPGPHGRCHAGDHRADAAAARRQRRRRSLPGPCPVAAEAEGRPGASTRNPREFCPQSRAGDAGRAPEVDDREADCRDRLAHDLDVPARADQPDRGPDGRGQQGRRAQVEHAPSTRPTTLVVGPDFIKDVTKANLDNRITMLRLVFLEKDALIEQSEADFGFAAVTDGSSELDGGRAGQQLDELADAVTGRTAGAGRRHPQASGEHHGERPAVRWRVRVGRVDGRRGIGDSPGPDPDAQDGRQRLRRPRPRVLGGRPRGRSRGRLEQAPPREPGGRRGGRRREQDHEHGTGRGRPPRPR